MNTEIIKEIDVPERLWPNPHCRSEDIPVNPTWAVPTPVVLLRIVYETIHRAYRTVRCISGREELETDSQSATNMTESALW